MRFNKLILYLWPREKARRTTEKKDKKRRWLTHFLAKNGSSLRHPLPSNPNLLGTLVPTGPRVSVRLKTVFVVEWFRKCRLTLPPTRIASTGVRSSSLSTRSRDVRPSPASMVSTLLRTNFAPSSRNAKLSSRQCKMCDQLTDMS